MNIPNLTGTSAAACAHVFRCTYVYMGSAEDRRGFQMHLNRHWNAHLRRQLCLCDSDVSTWYTLAIFVQISFFTIHSYVGKSQIGHGQSEKMHTVRTYTCTRSRDNVECARAFSYICIRTPVHPHAHWTHNTRNINAPARCTSLGCIL